MKKTFTKLGLLLLLLCLFVTTFVSCTGGGTGSGTTGGTPTTLPPTTGATTATPTQPPVQIIDATIAQVLAGALDQDYRVTGTVAAVSPTTFLLTDEYGNYLYIYAEVEHELAVGDQARVVGTKVAYANIVELKSIQSIERLS